MVLSIENLGHRMTFTRARTPVNDTPTTPIGFTPVSSVAGYRELPDVVRRQREDCGLSEPAKGHGLPFAGAQARICPQGIRLKIQRKLVVALRSPFVIGLLLGKHRIHEV
jgi:hypothetical protein